LAAWAEVRNVGEIPYQLGQLELYRGDPQKALIYLQEARKLEPDNEAIQLAQINATLLNGQADMALKMIAALSSQSAGSASGLSLKGRALVKVGKLDEGIRALKKAVDHVPEAAGFRLELADALLLARQREAAVTEYRRYLELSQQLDIETELMRWLNASQAGDSRP